jgi:Flp pilus assembly protein TadD
MTGAGDPTASALALQRARMHLRSGELEEALRLFFRASKLDPSNPLSFFGMARVHNRLARTDEARRAIDQALALRPNDARFLCELANIDALEGNYDSALVSVAQALKHDPTHALALSGQVEFLRRLGREDEAFERCRRALDRGARHIGVLGIFAELGPPRGAASEATALVNSAVANSSSPIPARAMLLNRLSIGLEKAGEYDLAFDAATRMNRLRAGDWNPDSTEAWLRARLGALEPDTIAAMERSSVRSEKPVFIVGMPRSGTSLLEQILDCHPAVTGIGEHGEVASIVEDLHQTYAPGPPSPESFTIIPRHALDARAKAHLRTLEALGGGAKRVSNKMPANALYLPEIAALYPHARFVRCARDPRDTCVSCYMTDFSFGHQFTTDLEALARYFALHEEFLAKCADVLEIAVRDVCYERLVRDPEQEIRQTLEFLGLEWNDACLRHHESDRQVRTASHEQATRPIYSSSVGRWRRYERHLGPLLQTLRDAGALPPDDD